MNATGPIGESNDLFWAIPGRLIAICAFHCVALRLACRAWNYGVDKATDRSVPRLGFGSAFLIVVLMYVVNALFGLSLHAIAGFGSALFGLGQNAAGLIFLLGAVILAPALSAVVLQHCLPTKFLRALAIFGLQTVFTACLALPIAYWLWYG